MFSRQAEGAAFLGWRPVVFNSRIPPLTFSVGKIRRELHGEPSLSVVLFLNPHPLPDVIGQGMRDEPAVFPGIGTVSLFIERECDDGAIFVIPLSGQHTPILRDA